MTETKIRHITNDDIQGVITPCYITSQGEVYQYHRKLKAVVQKTNTWSGIHQHIRVSIGLDSTRKNCTTSIALPSTVYRLFSGEENLPKNLFIGYKDGNPLNCSIDNLMRVSKTEKKRPYRNLKNKQKSAKMAENAKKQTLTLTDFSSFLALFDLMKRHKPLELTPNEVILDTEYLSPEELNRLKKMKLDERVKII